MIATQIASPLIYVLLGAMVVTLVMRRWEDSIVIGIVIVINTIVGFIQEYRAENAIQALINRSAPTATIRRDREETEVESSRLVPGDIVLISAGGVNSVREENPENLTFLGFQGMMDPPREDAIRAIENCRRAGIRVMMVTGDNPVTALAIARTVAIGEDGDVEVFTGAKLERLSDRRPYHYRGVPGISCFQQQVLLAVRLPDAPILERVAFYRCYRLSCRSYRGYLFRTHSTAPRP